MEEKNNLFEPVTKIDNKVMKELGSLASRQLELEQEKKDLQEQIEKVNESIMKISREFIPSIFNENNIKELKLQNGFIVKVKDELKASVPKVEAHNVCQKMIDLEIENRGPVQINEEEVKAYIRKNIEDDIITHYNNANTEFLCELKELLSKSIIPETTIYEKYYNRFVEVETNYRNSKIKDEIENLFKSIIIISESLQEAEDLLIEKNIPFNKEKSIHWKTLQKYCKDVLEQGKNIPEGISVFQYQETKIKKQ